jgi:divalent metal cation (Fe/Co/Zn/Cd) transporter
MLRPSPSRSLERQILLRIAPVLEASGIGRHEVRCRTQEHGFDLDVHVDLQRPVSHRVEHALAVRVLDAVTSSGERYGTVDVHVDVPGS